MNYIQDPMAIERESFRIIAGEIHASGREFPRVDPRFDALIESIVTRAIHTSADFDYLDNLRIDPDFLARFAGRAEHSADAPLTLYTDTNMALSGVNKRALDRLGWRIHCYVADPEVAAIASAAGITRSMAAVDRAMREPGDKLFVFGNAPTAIFRLLERFADDPSVLGVIGVPVGFVGAAESKQMLADSPIPSITALGRKGGSNVAAAIVNALLYETAGRG